MEMNIGRERAYNDQDHSKTVISVLIIYVLEILDSVKYLPNGIAPHTECKVWGRVNKYHFYCLSNLLLEIKYHLKSKNQKLIIP